jgi:hypothetical protein
MKPEINYETASYRVDRDPGNPLAFSAVPGCSRGFRQVLSAESGKKDLLLRQDRTFRLVVVDLAKDPLNAGPLARSTT